MQFSGIGVAPDHRAFHCVFLGKPHEFIQVFRTNGNRHALLGFGNPNLPLIKALIFKRHFLKSDLAAVRIARRLTDRGRQAPAAVVGDKLDESFIAGFQQKIMHLFLGVGVSNLHMSSRCVFRKGFRGGGHAVNTIFANPAATHDHTFTGGRPFLFGGFIVDASRHDADRGDKYQAFTQVAGIEYHLAEGGRDATLVAAVPHAFDDAVQQAPRMQVGLQVTLIVSRSNTIPVTSHNQA